MADIAGGPKDGEAKSAGGRGRGGGTRQLKTRVRTAKGRKSSSTRWLQRQLNDPYVEAARKRGLRSRAAFKLQQIDEKHGLFRPGMCVVDLGAAPGGWSVVVARLVAAGEGRGRVIAVDPVRIEAIPGVDVLEMDFLAGESEARLLDCLAGQPVDAVISDMAAPASGHKQTDHLRIMALCEAALEFARKVLAPDGLFLAKVLQGGTEADLLAAMKRDFASVRHIKPDASRADSSELYVLASGYRGPTAM